MKNSAKWEVRVGLLLGLAFIVAFGMILSELRDPVTQSAGEEQLSTTVGTSYYNPVVPALRRETYHAENQNVNPVPVAALPPRQTTVASRDVRVDMTHLDSAVISRDVTPTPAPAVVKPRRAVQHIQEKPLKRMYRVAEGDTLYEIAEKVYGPGKGAKWRKIYQANREKLSNPLAITPGKSLVIPPLEQAAALPTHNASDSQQAALNDLQRHITGRAGQASKSKVYIVKSGDNLTKIARKYFNDSSNASINKIFEANRHQLNDPNDIVIGMKLKIPKN